MVAIGPDDGSALGIGGKIRVSLSEDSGTLFNGDRFLDRLSCPREIL